MHPIVIVNKLDDKATTSSDAAPSNTLTHNYGCNHFHENKTPRHRSWHVTQHERNHITNEYKHVCKAPTDSLATLLQFGCQHARHKERSHKDRSDWCGPQSRGLEGNAIPQGIPYHRNVEQHPKKFQINCGLWIELLAWHKALKCDMLKKNKNAHLLKQEHTLLESIRLAVQLPTPIAHHA